MTTSSLFRAAKAFADAFESRQRDDGAPFLCLADNAPDWMRDAVREAHDGELPNDYAYDMARDAVEFIAEALEGDDGREFIDDSADAAHDFAEAAVSVYNADAVRWLADNLSRADYVARAVEEFGASLDADEFGAGIFGMLRAGMVAQALDAFAAIASAIESAAPDYAPFAAGWNTPGYMPDSEPQEFDDFDDAKAYLIDTLLMLESDDGEGANACRSEGDAEGFERLEANAEEYRAAAEALNHETAAPVAFNAGAFAFWILERDA